MAVNPSSNPSTQSNASQQWSRYISSGFMENGRSVSLLFSVEPTGNNYNFEEHRRNFARDNLRLVSAAIAISVLTLGRFGITTAGSNSLSTERALFDENFLIDLIERTSNRGVLQSSKEKLGECLIPSFQEAKNLIEQKYPEKIASSGPGVLKRIENLGFLKAIRSGVDLAPFIKEAATDGSNVIKEIKKNLKELCLKFVNSYQELIDTEVVTAQAFQEYVIDGGKEEDKKMQDAYSALQHFVQAILLQDRKMENILTKAAYLP